jgi:hypothetical protein
MPKPITCFKDLNAYGTVERPPWYKELFRLIRREGTLFDGPIINEQGDIGWCQTNVAKRVLEEKTLKLTVWLGWALDYDAKHWFGHACAYDLATGTLYEVTCPLKAYFGSVLDDPYTKHFLSDYGDRRNVTR